MKTGIPNTGTTSVTNLLGAALVCAALTAWGCSQGSKVAVHEHDHDHEHCTCHDDHDHHGPASLEEIKSQLAKLSDEDRKLAEAQGFCVVKTSNALGSMGSPYKLTIDGRVVFLCCEHCQDAALKDPKATLATLDGLLQKHSAGLPKNTK